MHCAKFEPELRKIINEENIPVYYFNTDSAKEIFLYGENIFFKLLSPNSLLHLVN